MFMAVCSDFRIDAVMLSLEPQDYNALLSFKQDLLKTNPADSTLLQSWSDNAANPCHWAGVECTYLINSTRVLAIDLSNNNLAGVISPQLGNLTALKSLSLSRNKLMGSIPAELGGLAELTQLDLSDNLLSGNIPSTLGELENLQVLNLAYNKLVGGIPASLFYSCSSLHLLNASNNPDLGGQIPIQLQKCKNLTVLELENANLGGNIPEEIGSLASLKHVNLGTNNLTGSIQSNVFGSCGSLQYLDLSLNNLFGDIPSAIANCSSLTALMLSQNHFASLPSEISTLSNLQWLIVGQNIFSGVVPPQIAMLSNLQLLDLRENLFSGTIPSEFSQLKKLQCLMLNKNNFVGNIPTHFGMLPSLLYLDASNNQLSGRIPAYLTNIISLQFLLLASNNYSGAIPQQIGFFANLQLLDISSNKLTGSIPSSIGNLQSLLWLHLSNNQLTGPIPSEIGNCASLVWLNLSNNSITGSLPATLSFMSRNAQLTFEMNVKTLLWLPKHLGDCDVVLRWLPNLAYPFSTVPPVLSRDRCQVFWNLLVRGTSLAPLCKIKPDTPSNGYIQLSMNNLIGSISASLGNISNLGLLFLSNNNFSGSIPEQISRPEFSILDFSHNSLTGTIPSSISEMACLSRLDLSYNNLIGTIPPSLQSCSGLVAFNVSFNPELSGPIPIEGQFSTFDKSSFLGDDLLCYTSLPSNSANSSWNMISACESLSTSSVSDRKTVPGKFRHAAATIVLITLACCLAGMTIALAGVCFLRKKASTYRTVAKTFMKVGRNNNESGDASVEISLFSMELPKKVTYSDLLIATNNFDEAHVVGSGGFGVVYKAKLIDGTTIAIKKLIQEGLQADREFLAEMETLGHVHHDNLVPLLGCCSFNTEKLLVYKYMVNGSLDDWLYERVGGAETLVWPLRLNIALGMARGLKFLHHNCSPPIIHRDMKASNILLDENFDPRLTDFGLARVLGSQDTHVSTVVAGTVGYVPPEYCQTWRATFKGDVYSFGVVLLELITGRRPMDSSFSDINCFNVVDWVVLMIKNRREREVYDPIVMRSAATSELFQFLKLAICCTEQLHTERPTMREVLRTLEDVKAGNNSSS
ncbi:hypothetical protein O6H91_21G070000 [Diphasiastrum complanatum]|uniref:Uncharacterized protein n=1 Tax=Diphasiastrum complanatum TaxID=34168 RepID=A0ACC2ALT2_DIPCM|nr:hypothetical protein O6H91_21G070000 [Diphasiastrum complanatum]